MTDRARIIDAFLAAAGWDDAARAPLARDASLRRYIRLHRTDGTAMLMDAPPQTGEDVRPFLAIATHLTAAGLSPPQILAKDADNGLLLLEDLGDDLLSRSAAADPGLEPELYAAAAETLAALQATPPPAGLHPYPADMPDLAATIVDWYAPEARAKRPAIKAAIADALAALPPGPDVLVHRDYHADNLIWLPDRTGPRRIGLLDFQDAMTGPAEYDLASLIHDPRRPVTSAAAQVALTTWLDATGTAADAATHRIAVCSVQRSLRILGRVFSRLSLHGGRDSYLRFIPATWTALQRELTHPGLRDLKTLLDPILPEPTQARLDALRAAKGRFQDQPHAEAYA
ncbi:MAG: phosphotransferase [Pseudomonadota bacterium]